MFCFENCLVYFFYLLWFVHFCPSFPIGLSIFWLLTYPHLSEGSVSSPLEVPDDPTCKENTHRKVIKKTQLERLLLLVQTSCMNLQTASQRNKILRITKIYRNMAYMAYIIQKYRNSPHFVAPATPAQLFPLLNLGYCCFQVAKLGEGNAELPSVENSSID